MATGTKARGWPLMANCILHSSFVNCCLPSSHFLLGHGTKPRTGGIRNGTSAPPMHSQPLSTLFSLPLFHSLSSSLLFSLYLSLFLSPLSRASFHLPLTVCTPMTSPILFFPFSFPPFFLFFTFSLDMRSSLSSQSHFCDVLSAPLFFSLPPSLPAVIRTDADKTEHTVQCVRTDADTHTSLLFHFFFLFPPSLRTELCVVTDNFSFLWTKYSSSTQQDHLSVSCHILLLLFSACTRLLLCS